MRISKWLVGYLCLTFMMGNPYWALAAFESAGGGGEKSSDTSLDNLDTAPYGSTTLTVPSVPRLDPYSEQKRAGSKENFGASDLLLKEELPGAGFGSEYVSGYYPGAVLIPVNIWGAVQKTGVHHIPMKTSLISLITLAGGPTSEAKLDEVVIRRQNKEKEEVINVDVKEMVNNPLATSPAIEANDLVFVAVKKPFIDANVLTLVGILTSVAAVTLSAILVARR